MKRGKGEGQDVERGKEGGEVKRGNQGQGEEGEGEERAG